MTDFSVSLGCGDYPTNELDDTQTNVGYTETEEEIQEKIAKGYIKDSAGQSYDPTNYINCYYADSCYKYRLLAQLVQRVWFTPRRFVGSNPSYPTQTRKLTAKLLGL